MKRQRTTRTRRHGGRLTSHASAPRTERPLAITPKQPDPLPTDRIFDLERALNANVQPKLAESYEEAIAGVRDAVARRYGLPVQPVRMIGNEPWVEVGRTEGGVYLVNTSPYPTAPTIEARRLPKLTKRKRKALAARRRS